MSGRALGPEMQGTDAVLRLMRAVCGAIPANVKRRLHCGASWRTAEQGLVLAIFAE